MECLNRQVEYKLAHWMDKNKTTSWAAGCDTVQWACNTQHHKVLGQHCSPYLLTFGQNPRVGLSSLPIDKELLATMLTERDLRNHFNISEDLPLDEAMVKFAVDKNVSNLNDDEVESEEVPITTTTAACNSASEEVAIASVGTTLAVTPCHAVEEAFQHDCFDDDSNMLLLELGNHKSDDIAANDSSDNAITEVATIALAQTLASATAMATASTASANSVNLCHWDELIANMENTVHIGMIKSMSVADDIPVIS